MSFSQIAELPSSWQINDKEEYWKKNYQYLPERTKRLLEKYKEEDKNRPKSIVSSYCIGAILGESNYNKEKCEEQIFKEKTKQIPEKEMTIAMLNGIEKEPIVAQKFSDKINKGLFRLPVVVYHENPYIAVNIDRLTEDGYNVEIKTSFSESVADDDETENWVCERHIEYWHQMQLQMFVLDIEKSFFVRWGGPPNPFHDSSQTKFKNLKIREVLSIIEVQKDPFWWFRHNRKIFDFIDKVLLYQKEESEFFYSI